MTLVCKQYGEQGFSNNRIHNIRDGNKKSVNQISMIKKCNQKSCNKTNEYSNKLFWDRGIAA